MKLNLKELILYIIYKAMGFIIFIPMKIGNKAVDKLNKSYFKPSN